jgi:crossover junction endodeoxyribonuclease RuvC|tara:strand:- start:1281 stop:1781 length:501 start_codon:yes stop_codon:yes gene_type:complete
MFIIGIDPGISGAICFFESDIIKDVIEMPVMADGKKNKRQINGPQIVNEIQKRIENIPKKNIFVVVEHVSAMPGQGVTSMFNFGQSFGVIKGICSALKLPIYFVRPVKWKKYFNLIKTDKEASRSKAIQIFPYISSKLSKKKDNNKADAILIASFFNNTFKSETQS